VTFALSGSTITQSGTDTNLSGLAGIAGVVTRVEGAGTYIKTRYYLPAATNLTYNNLSWDPRSECLIFGSGGSLLQAATTTSVLTIGNQITQSGGTYSHQSEALIFTGNQGNAYQVAQGFRVLQGTFNWYSGIIRAQEGMGFGATQYDNGGAVGTLKGYIGPYAALEVMRTPSGQTNESCQLQFACDPAFVVDGMTVRGYGTTPPSYLISLASTTAYTTPFAFNLEGGGGITAQAAGRITNFANFCGLQSKASPKGFNLFLGSLIRGVNQALGSAVVIVEHNVDPSHPQGYVELRNEVDCTFKNIAGATQQGVVLYCKDTNNGKRQTYNLNGVVINNTADKVYIGTSGATGNVNFAGLTNSILLAAVVRNTAGTVVGVDDTGLNAKDYRSISGTKGADDFRFYSWGYGFLPDTSVEILKSDKVAKFLSKTLLPDTAVTLTEAQAVAKLASSFTVAGTVLTVTASSTLDDLYDSMKAYKTRPVQTQLEFPGIGVQPVTAAGDQLTTAMTVTVNAGVTLAGGAKFKSLSSGLITLLGSITGFEVVGNVTQATPTNLTSVTITGTLAYNTATATPVTYTNVTAGTVNNSGAGLVTVKRINSTLTAGTNVVAFAPTSIAFTLGGGRIRVLDNLGVEQYNQTADGTFELPAAATGTWTYTIRKYAQLPIVGAVTIDGTTKAIFAAYIPDTQVVDTEANVAAYTALDSSQQIYDYLSLYGATAAGIAFGSVASKGFGTLAVPAGLILNPAAAAIVAISAGVVTTKTNGLSESVTLISTGNIVQGAATLSGNVALRAANLDSELIYSADAITFYSSAADRNAGTNPGASVTGGLYRFKLGATVSGVLLSGTVALRVTVGGITFFADVALAAGRNVLDLGVQSQLAALNAKTLTIAQLNATTIPVDLYKIKGQVINGNGSELTPWGP
jgi:hypothetical protein